MNTMINSARPVSRRTLFGGALAAAGATAIAGGTHIVAATAAPEPAAALGRSVAPMGTGPETPAELSFSLLPSPVRAYDSRPGLAPDGTDPNTGAGDTALTTGTTRKIDICYALGAAMSATGVPEGAAGVMCNMTVTGTVSAGWLRVWSYGATEPTTASINWSASGQTVGNCVTSACSSGYINVKCGAGTGGSTHLVIDVIGYYSAVFTGP